MHNATITTSSTNNHGYPYRAACSCGWSSLPYAAKHAAQGMADDHITSITEHGPFELSDPRFVSGSSYYESIAGVRVPSIGLLAR